MNFLSQISPNNTITAVIDIESTTTVVPLESVLPMIRQVANVESVTIEILMRLFKIRIVASNLCGFASNFTILFSFACFDCAQLSSSSAVSEK